MGFGWSRDRWEEYLFDRVGQPLANAVVYQAKGKTIAKVWSEQRERFKRIAQKNAGVADAEVVKSTIDTVTEGSRIVIICDITVKSAITLLKRVILLHYGIMYNEVPDGEAAIVIGSTDTVVDYSHIYVHYVKGTYAAKDFAKIINGRFNRVKIDHLRGARYAFYLKQESEDVRLGGNIFEYGHIDWCEKALYIPAPPSGQSAVWAEGTQMLGGGIFVSDYGVHVENGAHAGGMYITGTIDNVAKSGSYDYVNEMSDTELGSLLNMKYIRPANSVFHQKDVVMIPSEGFVEALKVRAYLPDLSRAVVLDGNEGAIEMWRDNGIPYIDMKNDQSEDYRVRIIKTTDDGLRFLVNSGTVALTLEADGHVNATNYGIKTKYFVDDYGGNFANFTPPSGEEGLIIIAIDTNSTNPGKRLYVYANGAWHYVDLS